MTAADVLPDSCPLVGCQARTSDARRCWVCPDRFPRRVQLRRVRGWRMPPRTVSVARPHKLGNPYLVTPMQTASMAVHWFAADLDAALAGLTHIPHGSRSLLLDRFGTAGSLRGYLVTLIDTNLACFCPLGDPCHADIVLDRIVNLRRQVDDALD